MQPVALHLRVHHASAPDFGPALAGLTATSLCLTSVVKGRGPIPRAVLLSSPPQHWKTAARSGSSYSDLAWEPTCPRPIRRLQYAALEPNLARHMCHGFNHQGFYDGQNSHTKRPGTHREALHPRGVRIYANLALLPLRYTCGKFTCSPSPFTCVFITQTPRTSNRHWWV